jgi:hypothetical protein
MKSQVSLSCLQGPATASVDILWSCIFKLWTCDFIYFPLLRSVSRIEPTSSVTFRDALGLWREGIWASSQPPKLGGTTPQLSANPYWVLWQLFTTPEISFVARKCKCWLFIVTRHKREDPAKRGFSSERPDWLWGPPTSVDTRLLSRGWSGRDLKLHTHFQLAQRLRLPLYEVKTSFVCLSGVHTDYFIWRRFQWLRFRLYSIECYDCR